MVPLAPSEPFDPVLADHQHQHTTGVGGYDRVEHAPELGWGCAVGGKEPRPGELRIQLGDLLREHPKRSPGQA